MTPERDVGPAPGRAGRAARLDWRESVGSTNDEARALARRGAPSGTAVASREQTAGRGRRGRRWFSPPWGNVYLTVLHRSRMAPAALSAVSLEAGVAVAEVLESWGLEPDLKWPNDVRLDGRKVAGVLCELELGPGPAGTTAAVLVGVGVDLAGRPEAYPEELHGRVTTVQAALGGPAPDSAEAAQALGDALVRRLDAFEARGTGRPDLEAYRARFGQRGERVRAVIAGAERVGRVCGVGEAGELRVDVDGLGEVAVTAGEVISEACGGKAREGR